MPPQLAFILSRFSEILADCWTCIMHESVHMHLGHQACPCGAAATTGTQSRPAGFNLPGALVLLWNQVAVIEVCVLLLEKLPISIVDAKRTVKYLKYCRLSRSVLNCFHIENTACLDVCIVDKLRKNLLRGKYTSSSHN